MTTAYLLAVFRIDMDGPVFIGTEVLDRESVDHEARASFIVGVYVGETFEMAKAEVLRMAKECGEEWALRSLVQR